MKKFNDGDVLVNRIKTYPHCKFFVNTGSVVYNNKNREENNIPNSGVSLYEMNVDRDSNNLIYPFKSKDNTLTTFSTISTKDFNAFQYGYIMSGSYPLTASIYFEHHCENSTRTKVDVLKNIMNGYKYLSPNYSFGERDTQELTLVEIPSIFYGSSIRKGSVSLRFYNSGSMVGELKDTRRNGDLIESTGSNSGSVAGNILYGEGIVILTGSWSLNGLHNENYKNCPSPTSVSPSWKYFGVNVPSSSYEVEFSGVNYIDTLTMFCHMNPAEFNHSNNPTFIEKGQTEVIQTGSSGYIENDEISIKNIVKSSYDNTEEDFKKTTYASKIAIYDDQKNVIAIAKLATPLKKTEERNYTIKIKIDF